VGDHSADGLREIAEQCDALTKEMDFAQGDGNLAMAKELAAKILSINPADNNAKEIFLIPELEETDTTSLANTIPELPIEHPKDTVPISTAMEFEPVFPVDDSIMIDSFILEGHPVEAIENISADVNTSSITVVSKGKNNKRNRFVVKAGFSVLAEKKNNSIIYGSGHSSPQYHLTFFPSLNVGVYNIDGSRSGYEFGIERWEGVLISNAYVLRIARFLYTKLDVGIAIGDYEFSDLSIGLGTTFLLSDGFSIDLGLSYRDAYYCLVPSIKFGLLF
jgi:hypothetical protein